MLLARALVASLLLAACADQTLDRPRRPAAASSAEQAPAVDQDPPAEAPSATTPKAPPPPACATSLGHAITAEHGRLDGVVRTVVLPGDKECRSDDDHVIVQIDADGETYAAWINVESSLAIADPAVRLAELRAPLAFGAWVEGWHPRPGPLDYAATLGAHTTSFTPATKAALGARIAQVAKPGARASAYFEGFSTADGGHKVHRNGGGRDGAVVVLEPGGAPHWLLFHFAQQNF